MQSQPRPIPPDFNPSELYPSDKPGASFNFQTKQPTLATPTPVQLPLFPPPPKSLTLINHQITTLTLRRRALTDELSSINTSLSKLQEESKSIQISFFESSNKVTRLTMAGTERKRSLLSSIPTAPPSPEDAALTMLQSMSISERERFISDLLSRTAHRPIDS